MSEVKHSREPWSYSEADAAWPGGAVVYMGRKDRRFGVSVADARRIVAAVNAVAGIPTESLERGDLARALDLLAAGAVGEAVMGPSAVGDVLRTLGRLKP